MADTSTTPTVESIRKDLARHARPWYETDIDFLLAEVDRLKAVLREVAIPSLRYCEQKFDYDDQARLNCEAALDG